MSGQIKGESGGAWKSYEEISAGLSPKERASELKRRRIGLILGPLLFIIFLIMPPPEGLTFASNLAAGITLWTMVWWVCEPIPMPATSILVAALFVIFQVIPANTAFSQLGHTNTWVLLGTFIFMNSLVKHGFTTRAAYWILSLPVGKKGPYALLSLYIGAICILSCFLSNMATTMLFLVISHGMIEALKINSSHPMAKAMRLGAAYGSQAGGFGTPMGAAGTNFLAIGLIVSLTGFQFTVADWMKIGIPFMLVMMIVLFIYFRLYFKFELPNYEEAHNYSKSQLKALGPMSRGEKMAVIITLAVMIGWLLPGIVSTVWGRDSSVYAAVNSVFNSAAVSIIGGVLCFLVPVDRKEHKYVMTWTEANRYIDWGALLLVSAGLIMAAALRAENVGILSYITESVGNVLGDTSPFISVLIMTAFGVVMTQLVSNIAAIAITLPVGYAVATAVGLNPVAMMMTLAIASQQSYALPVAAPQMAFVYGTGGISMKDFVKAGCTLSFISIFVTAIVGYYLSAALFPI
jgi:sodium-dependent dicarboxylate transporter 2/3/5